MCISDQKIHNKERLGRQFRCIERLVALACSFNNDNKIQRLAAYSLANLATVPKLLKIILAYEQDLFIAATTDESISKVLLGILNS